MGAEQPSGESLLSLFVRTFLLCHIFCIRLRVYVDACCYVTLHHVGIYEYDDTFFCFCFGIYEDADVFVVRQQGTATQKHAFMKTPIWRTLLYSSCVSRNSHSEKNVATINNESVLILLAKISTRINSPCVYFDAY